MKKLILTLLLFAGVFAANAQMTCTNVPCYPMSSTDTDNLFQALMYNHTVSINGGSVTASGSVVVTNTVQIANGEGSMATKANQAVEIVTLTNIYGAINSSTNVSVSNTVTTQAYNTYTNITFTISSTNTGVATAQNRAIGVMSYTVTLPTGTWEIQNVNGVTSPASSTASWKMYVFTGAVNCATISEGSVIDFTVTLAPTYQGCYRTTSSSFTYGNTLGFYSFYPIPSSGTFDTRLHCGFTNQIVFAAIYDAVYTPASNTNYIMNLALKRVN